MWLSKECHVIHDPRRSHRWRVNKVLRAWLTPVGRLDLVSVSIGSDVLWTREIGRY